MRNKLYRYLLYIHCEDPWKGKNTPVIGTAAAAAAIVCSTVFCEDICDRQENNAADSSKEPGQDRP